jgi:hypothetical protein
VRRHVRLRSRLVERRAGERILATAPGPETEQGIERVATAATRSELGDQRFDAAADIEAEVVVAGTGRLAERAREIVGRRRRRRIRRERIPVGRNASGGGRRRRERACRCERRRRRWRCTRGRTKAGKRIGEWRCRCRGATGHRRRRREARKISKGVGCRRSCSRTARFDAHRVAADLQLVTRLDECFLAVAERAPVHRDRIAAAIDDRVAPVAEHDLRVHSRDRSLRIGKDELIVLGAADVAAQLVKVAG